MDEAAPPLTCRVGALSAEENRRRRSLMGELHRQKLAESASQDALVWTLPRDRRAWLAAAELVTYEWACCPFLSFDLALAADGTAFTLTLAGPPGAAEIVRAELMAAVDAEAGLG